MTKYELKVMRNIIYAVETGGQVYGNKDYGAFIEAYTNTSNEKAITIGAGQWHGVQAQNLLRLIRTKNASGFSALDTAGISSDLDSADWSVYAISKSSAKAKCIINIIKSETGRSCQDQLVDDQMKTYIAEIGQLGVTDMDAKMMCANFKHHGGAVAVTRILAKTSKPYTLDKIYASCQTDTGNQVGTYKSRQKMVYDSLKKYISNQEVTPESAIQAVIKIAQDEVGYLEKRSSASLDSKKDNAGAGNWTKYWRDMRSITGGYYGQGQDWCACFVSWVFTQAFGLATATKLLKHEGIEAKYYIYCPTLGNLFAPLEKTPRPGDVVLFWRDSGVYGHTGLVTEVKGGKYYTVEGNTNPNSGVVSNGEGVYSKSYPIDANSGHRFARLNYSLVNEIHEGGSGEQPYPEDSWKTTGTATCTGDMVNVRETPGGTVIGSLSRGARFEVDGSKFGEWVHIKVPGFSVGYMHQDYVSYDSESGGEWIKTGTAMCTGDEVYVRATPGGSIRGWLYRGERFEVDGTKSGVWVHIKVSGIGIGYMHQDYVSYDGSSVTWNRKGTATCSGEGVYVRKTPGGSIIGIVSRGTSLEYDGTKSGVWVHIKVAGIGVGYMHQDYVSYGGSSSGTSYIRSAQSVLNSYFSAGLIVDGIWGPASNTALIQAIQLSLNRVYGAGLIADGIWGANTASACRSHLLRRGDNNLYVRVLQTGLYRFNIGLSNGIDGDFGVSTEQGLKVFQENNGLMADGIAGHDTFAKLVGML